MRVRVSVSVSGKPKVRLVALSTDGRGGELDKDYHYYCCYEFDSLYDDMQIIYFISICRN